MSAVPTDTPFIHRIDADDRIVHANAGWWEFAKENGAHDLTPEKVLGRSVYDFIDGDSTKAVLRLIIERARGGRTPHPIPYRCDAPALRRFMEMRVRQALNGEIEFINRVIRFEIDPSLPPSAHFSEPPDFLRVCSWCKKVRLPDGTWEDLRSSSTALEMFASTHGRPLTHGICDDCVELFA